MIKREGMPVTTECVKKLSLIGTTVGEYHIPTAKMPSTQVFAIKRELSTHRRTHSGEGTHACTQCGKEFGTRQLLKKHWMWHTGQRSHVCPHCNKAFFQVRHKRV